MDWVPPHGVWGDGLMFVFDGGVIDADQLGAVVATDTELDGLALLDLDDGRRPVAALAATPPPCRR